ncbi:hypothetical protein PIB30_109424, partial [Stylosanthes scabra]|nr:hypothetical protein [Stylosanthes scabra]
DLKLKIVNGLSSTFKLGDSYQPFGHHPGTHAYAWHISPRPFPEFKVPRICVDISQLPKHMRDPLPPSKASIKVTPRICASSDAYAWPITFICSSAFQEQVRPHAYAWTSPRNPRICVAYITKAISRI